MGKGFPRSLKRQNKSVAAIVKDTIDMSNFTVTVSAAGAGVGFGSVQIHDFPQGNILLVGVGGTVGFAGSGSDANLTDDWIGDFGIGTTAADDATITGADVDIVASQDTTIASSEVVAAQRVAEAHADAGGLFDNTDGSLEVNFNMLIDAAEITDASSVEITLSGSIDIAYIVLGDD